MPRPIVAANWKMNGNKRFAENYLAALEGFDQVDIVIFPPSIVLSDLVRNNRSNVRIGVQNIHEKKEGAYTGEISAEMAFDSGASYALVGHSERRGMFGESEDLVSKKYEACIRAGLTPVLCVGEKENERSEGLAEKVIERQIRRVFKDQLRNLSQQAIIAYEPVWAIGSGLVASLDQVRAMHKYIRSVFRSINEESARTLRVLYGGSLRVDNVESIFAEQEVDGGLVGGASLDPSSFKKICEAAEKIWKQ